VTRRWIVDAAPLILLAKAQHLSLLEFLADEVLLPSAVVREIRRGPADDPARRALDAGFGTRLPYLRPPAAVRALGLLGAGERAMLSAALKVEGCTVVVDDRKGRTAADALGIPKVGTLGVILRARTMGHLSAIVPVMHDLLDAGLFIHEGVLREMAERAGERWP
jgi:predicted nucleic acid-binding protein